ncbi:hypothetical protein HAX54_022821 [Datura stramonium]|uniref:Uncharacterized protein n=1 Tax=Datura stramonium TaxID=4076 RepID=A0ABS8UWI1_DATST|nr:hypothetical protein [Datura stramonium]
MKALRAKGYSDTEIPISKGAKSKFPTNKLNGSSERKGEQDVAPQSGKNSDDTLMTASIEEMHEGHVSEVSIDTTLNHVLHVVNNLIKSHCKDKEGDTILEVNIITHHDETSNIVQDSDTKVCQKYEQSKFSTVHKIDTPQGFEIPNDLLRSQFSESRITMRRPNDLDYATTVHRNRQPGPWNRSPYLTDFGFASTSSIILTPIMDKKHPFENSFIMGRHNNDMIQLYSKWIHNGLLKNHTQK